MRLSVTTIEAFRLYRDNVSRFDGEPYVSQEELIKRIKGEVKKSIYMTRGTAFHEILAEPKKYLVKEYNRFTGEEIQCFKHLDCKFDETTMNQALRYAYPTFPYEIKEVKPFEIDGEILNVVGVADQLVGNAVIENKTKWSNYSIQDYMNAYQWRFYLDLFEAETVIYQIFTMKEKKEILYCTGINTLKMTPYPNLKQDIERILSEFLKFIEINNLQEFLKDKEN